MRDAEGRIRVTVVAAAVAAGKGEVVMRKYIAVAVLLASTAFAAAAPGTPPPPPSITVSGTGKIVYVPDIGYIHVGVSSDAKTAAEAWKKNEAIVKQIFEALK